MRLRSLVLVGVALGLAGCSSGPNIVGKWVVDSGSRDTGTKAGDDFAKGFDKLNTIEFRADKTFTRTILFAFEGTYEVSGNTITMKITKAMGMEVTKIPGYDPSKFKPQTGTISSDGKSISVADDSGKATKYVRETS